MMKEKQLSLEKAIRRFNEEKCLSMKAARYLMNMSLSKTVSLSSDGLEEELSKYRKKLDEISSLCQPEIEFVEFLMCLNYGCKNVSSRVWLYGRKGLCVFC